MLRHHGAPEVSQDKVLLLVNDLIHKLPKELFVSRARWDDKQINRLIELYELSGPKDEKSASALSIENTPLYQQLRDFHYSPELIKAVTDDKIFAMSLRENIIPCLIRIMDPVWLKNGEKSSNIERASYVPQLYAAEMLLAICGEYSSVENCGEKIRLAQKSRKQNTVEFLQFIRHCRSAIYGKLGHPPSESEFMDIVVGYLNARKLSVLTQPKHLEKLSMFATDKTITEQKHTPISLIPKPI